MAYRTPSIDDLRRESALFGVTPSDEDLERVQAFLAVLLPQLDQLERIVEADATPAAVFRPEVEG